MRENQYFLLITIPSCGGGTNCGNVMSNSPNVILFKKLFFRLSKCWLKNEKNKNKLLKILQFFPETNIKTKTNQIPPYSFNR